jgi:transglutaminase-like putative cysteine protease
VTAERLNVPGQTFEGTVTDGRIQGVFTIRPPRVEAAATPPFPVPEGAFAAPGLQRFLGPEADIESDDAGIAAKARELAAGASTCLEVVERLARWAHDEIPYEIPGGGSAKRTFETRRGECGGHSRVLAAMLRSLGIPARTPMGGMYVPLYGGSFAQHMWTEVWLGAPIGWHPVDCTAGQWTYIDAGHIRLSDAVTSFRPKVIEVLDHEPKAPAGEPAPVGRRSDVYPFTVGQTLTYDWSIGGQRLGDERITYRGAVDGAHVFESDLSLQGDTLTETTRTRVGDDGRILQFHAERTSGPVQETFDVSVADGVAQFTKKSMDGERSDSLRVDPSVFALHNNCTVHFALATTRLGPLVEGAEHKVRFVHTEQRSVFPMTLRPKGCAEIDIGGAKVEARVVEASLGGMAFTLHVDDQGRLLRFQQAQGEVRIELRKP